MRIAINTPIAKGPWLNEQIHLIQQLLGFITKTTKHQFLILATHEHIYNCIQAAHVTHSFLNVASQPVVWRKFWYKQKLNNALKAFDASFLIQFDVSLSTNKKTPQVFFIIDTHIQKKITLKKLQQAQAIITTNNFIKNQLATKVSNTLPLEVITIGTEEKYAPINFAQKQAVQEQFTAGEAFFLYNPINQTNQHIITVLKAFSFFKKRLQSGMKLIVATPNALVPAEIHTKLLTYKFRNDVVLVENVTSANMYNLQATAYALLHLVLNDVYGTAINQSMALGVPIIASNTGCVPEITQNAALLVDDITEQTLAQQMMLLYKDENLRNQLINQGLSIIQNKTEPQQAQKFWHLIEQIATP